ncbi:MAG: 16S rRNA (cytidine(1402)-2'-O)-methyltransferase, partial [Candidatus Dormibacteria bacterium]
MPGTLYVTATPIGNLGDLSPRAAALLARVELVVAEDTRHSRRLLQELGARPRMLALPAARELERVPQVLAALGRG